MSTDARQEVVDGSSPFDEIMARLDRLTGEAVAARIWIGDELRAVSRDAAQEEIRALLGKLDEATKAREAASAIICRTLLHSKGRIWIDVTPDEDLPRRILQAYIDDEAVVSAVGVDYPALADAISAPHRARVEILHRAMAREQEAGELRRLAGRLLRATDAIVAAHQVEEIHWREVVDEAVKEAREVCAEARKVLEQEGQAPRKDGGRP